MLWHDPAGWQSMQLFAARKVSQENLECRCLNYHVELNTNTTGSLPPGPYGCLPVQVFIEAADLDKLNQARQDSKAEMDKHLAETNKTLDTMRDEVNTPSPSSVWLMKPSSILSPQHSTLQDASEALHSSDWKWLSTVSSSLLFCNCICPDRSLPHCQTVFSSSVSMMSQGVNQRAAAQGGGETRGGFP